MNALQRLHATHEPLRELGTAWRERHDLDLARLEDLHVEATLAAHEQYCLHLPAYRTLAADLDLVDCRDVAVIRSELASTDDLFKSYDEEWIDAGDFAAMTRWLASIYAGPTDVDLAGVATIQDWLDALERRGTRVWFSSGTSGHLSFVPRDESAARNLDAQIGTLVGPLLGGAEAAAGYDAILLSFHGGRQGLASAADKLASVTGRQTYLYDFAVTPDGVRGAAKGDATAASEFRRRTVEELPQRYAVVLDALRRSVADGRPALLVGAPFQVNDICEMLAQASEYVTLPPGSLLFLAGGWKSFEGSKISRDELIATVTERLGITRVLESYGMTECTTQLPLCGYGRFHVPPTLWPMVFDDALMPLDGLGRGRFGFSDPFATSIPGIFISGDEVELTLQSCACGLPGYSFIGEVRRAAGREVKGLRWGHVLGTRMTNATLNSSERISDIGTFLRDHRLFVVDEHGMVRLPILVGGRLVVPSDITMGDAVAALGVADYAEVGDLQIVQQPRIDPSTLRDSGRTLLFVLPRVLDVGELCGSSADDVATDLAGLPAAEVARYLDRVGAALSPGTRLHGDLRALVGLTADTPIAYLDAALSGVALAFDGTTILRAVDEELALGAALGRDLLDGWVAQTEVSDAPSLTGQLSAAVHDCAALARCAPLQVRAMPTRQLHITAGNSPMIPVISAVRGLGVKGAVTLKFPAGALAAGAALAVAMYTAGPDHPLTRHASVVYWQGGDRRVEDRLFAPETFDRIVVWGAPAAVESVRARAGSTKTLTFNPRYGASMIGAEALTPATFDDTVRRAATDALVWNQKACIASLVHYVEGDRHLVDAYATALTAELARWDEHLPSPMSVELVGRVRQARRGAMRHGRWLSNGDPRSPASAVVVLDSAFDLAAHPASRIIAIRPVTRLEDALDTFHPGVSEVGVAPESRRVELRDRICAHGVTGVPPLGDADAVSVAGVPQDGMRAMSELVSWVTA